MAPSGSRKTWFCFVVVGLLTIHAGLLAYSAAVHSPTLNEPGHLVAGLSYWQFGKFDVYKVNPPLSRLVAALPVLAAGCKTDWTHYNDGPGDRPEMALGEAFVHVNQERSIWLFTIARWACIPFSLIGGYVVFRWARELYGATAGILSLVLWCFCPNVLGHSSLITPDMSATALGVAACYLFWHWLRWPTWWRTILCGASLGLAELAKMTLLSFYFIWPVMWLVHRVAERRTIRRRDWLRETGMLAVCAIMSVYILNLGYGFEGTFTRLGKYRFVSDSLSRDSADGRAPEAAGNRFEHSWLAAIPLPLPKNYVEGIDLQKRDFEHYSERSYLNGVWCDHGWWYYYVEALALKVPLGTWFLLLLASITRPVLAASGSRIGKSSACRAPLASDIRSIPTGSESGSLRAVPACNGAEQQPSRKSTTWRDEFDLLFPALGMLTFVSSQTGFSEHMRYVLPIFPFFFIWIGRIAVVLINQQRIVRILAAAALAWSIGSSVWIYPHSVSYFNELAGGPLGGPRYLLGSNVDWGQDLLFLKRWIESHPNAKPLTLVYFGDVDPTALGITQSDFDGPTDIAQGSKKDLLQPGWYAISVSILRGVETSNHYGNEKRVAISSAAWKSVHANAQASETTWATLYIAIRQVNTPTK